MESTVWHMRRALSLGVYKVPTIIGDSINGSVNAAPVDPHKPSNGKYQDNKLGDTNSEIAPHPQCR